MHNCTCKNERTWFLNSFVFFPLLRLVSSWFSLFEMIIAIYCPLQFLLFSKSFLGILKSIKHKCTGFRGWNVVLFNSKKVAAPFLSGSSKNFRFLRALFPRPMTSCRFIQQSWYDNLQTICIFHKHSKTLRRRKTHLMLTTDFPLGCLTGLPTRPEQCTMWCTMILVGKKKEEEWVAKNEDHVEGSYDLDRMMIMLIGGYQQRWWGS